MRHLLTIVFTALLLASLAVKGSQSAYSADEAAARKPVAQVERAEVERAEVLIDTDTGFEVNANPTR